MVSILQQNVNYECPKPVPLEKTMKDYLEESVDEKYYINSEKAMQLIDNLISNGTLADGQTDRQTIDLSINEPGEIKIANCIKARYDAGISNFKADGSGVVENQTKLIGGLGEKKSNNKTQFYFQDRVYEGDIALTICSRNPKYLLNE